MLKKSLLAMIFLAPLAASAAPDPSVTESAREIPVAFEVDVVVVGGSTGAVSAAVEAAGAGAKVFLAAPRTYLGEDMCATRRLWVEEGELLTTDLQKRLLADGAEPAGKPAAPSRPFTYRASPAPSGRHRDGVPPSRLSDGKWGPASRESVEYGGNVTITADLKGTVGVSAVTLYVYQRKGDFEVESVTVSGGNDEKTWKKLGSAKNERLGSGDFDEKAIGIRVPLDARCRYLRIEAKKSASSGRVLLGELAIETRKDGGASSERDEPASRAAAAPDRVLTPMHVKRTLDEALLKAGVKFLFGCYPTDLLINSSGNPAGIVMANRSGRQAVRAKIVIDATGRAAVARMAGASFAPYPAGPQVFTRVVIGGSVRTGAGIAGSRAVPSATGAAAVEYTLRLPMKDGSFASFAEAEQTARDLTFHPGRLDASEVLFQVPPDPMKGRASLTGEWPGASKVPLDVFRPAGVEALYVLGGCADVPRDAAEKLLRPSELMGAGARVGTEAAAKAKTIPAPHGVRVAGAKKPSASTGDIREFLTGLRPSGTGAAVVQSPQRSVPVIARYDVVVVGGGTGGAPAGIGAARRKATTLVVEYLHELGGVATAGLIGKYYHGYRGGFTREIDSGVGGIGGGKTVVAKAEYFRRANRDAGADVWFGTLGCGAFVEGSRVRGVVVATPDGRGVVLAGAVIDSTGNADIAAAAGAACIYTGADNCAVQGTGLPPRRPGASYTNTDYTFADDSDPVDIWHLFVYARQKFRGAYDLGRLVDSRERRRILGDHVVTPVDILNGRRYPDTVMMAKSNFDSHGFTIHPVFTLRPPGKQGMTAYVPYRSLLPQGLDGILVTGLGISAHRDAMPILRMQPDVQNQGYAAGVAAASAARSGRGTRAVDIKTLQKHLVEIKNIPEDAPTWQDTFPPPDKEIAAAVASAADGYAGLPVILAAPDRAVPMLTQAYAKASSKAHKLVYAHILGVLGNDAGIDALIDAVTDATKWDRGWDFKGMGQYGSSLSRLDSYIVALGLTRNRRALPALLEKTRMLKDTGTFSHHRAVAIALEALRDPAAAKPLAEILSLPGMSGHAVTVDSLDPAQVKAKVRENRSPALRELALARALWRCGDYDGLAKKILTAYLNDPHGHYARHARALLNEK